MSKEFLKLFAKKKIFKPLTKKITMRNIYCIHYGSRSESNSVYKKCRYTFDKLWIDINKIKPKYDQFHSIFCVFTFILVCYQIKFFCSNVFTVLTYKGGRPIIIIQLDPGWSKTTSPTGSGTLTGTPERVIQQNLSSKEKKEKWTTNEN